MISLVLLVLSTLTLEVLPIPTSTSKPVKCKTILKKEPSIISSATVDDLKLSTFNTDVDTIVKISCLSEGYTVQGATSLQCMASGKWSESIPKCKVSLSKKPKNMQLILGASIGGSACLLVAIVIAAIFLRRRKNKSPTQSIDKRLKDGQRKRMYSEEMRTRYTDQDTSLSKPPSVYKVWSYDRNVKKFISAYDFKELKQKGGKTFNIINPVIVLEEDGTEIEDDTALQACKDKTLQIFSTKNTWYRTSQISIESDGILDLRGSNYSDYTGTVRSYHL